MFYGTVRAAINRAVDAGVVVVGNNLGVARDGVTVTDGVFDRWTDPGLPIWQPG